LRGLSSALLFIFVFFGGYIGFRLFFSVINVGCTGETFIPWLSYYVPCSGMIPEAVSVVGGLLLAVWAGTSVKRAVVAVLPLP